MLVLPIVLWEEIGEYLSFMDKINMLNVCKSIRKWYTDESVQNILWCNKLIFNNCHQHQQLLIYLKHYQIPLYAITIRFNSYCINNNECILKILDYCQYVKELEILSDDLNLHSANIICNEIFLRIGRHTKLEKLRFRLDSFDKIRIKNLNWCNLNSLKFVEIGGGKYSRSLLNVLVEAKSLETFIVSGDEISNDDIKLICKLSNLKSLSLETVMNIDYKSLCYLKSLRYLTNIFIQFDFNFNLNGIFNVFNIFTNMNELKSLSLIGFNFNQEHFKSLPNNLECIMIRSLSSIVDDVQYLEHLTNLKECDLPMNANVVNQLHDILPNIRYIEDDEGLMYITL